MATTKTTKTTTKYAKTIAALAAGDKASWALADAVLIEVAPGMDEARQADYDALVADLSARGVSVPKWNDLRQKRGLAKFWTKSRRVPGLTITHHRAARPVGDVEAAQKLLTDLIAQNGANPGNVSVDMVKTAVAIAQGKPVPVAGSTAGKTGRTRKGSATLVSQTIEAGTPSSTLDGSAVTRAMAQCRALTQAILREESSTDLDTLRTVVANLLGRIDKVQGERAKAEARASAAPTKVGSAATPETKTKAAAAKAAKTKAAAPAGMRG